MSAGAAESRDARASDVRRAVLQTMTSDMDHDKGIDGGVELSRQAPGLVWELGDAQ